MLQRDGLIKYYKDKTLHRGTIMLEQSTIVKRNGKKAFDIVTPSRTWHLYAEDPAGVQVWITAIIEVIGTL